jgi:[ribosomal protein S18]-alanine N-acetyltransferase
MFKVLNKAPEGEPTPAVRIAKMEVDDLREILAIESSSFPTPWSRNLFIQELHNSLSRNLVAKISESGHDEIAGYMS